MNKEKIISKLPYVLLIIANFIYIYANGLKPIGAYPKLIMYNVLFFVIVGIVIVIKVNLLLHSWFIKEEGDVKKIRMANLCVIGSNKVNVKDGKSQHGHGGKEQKDSEK